MERASNSTPTLHLQRTLGCPNRGFFTVTCLILAGYYGPQVEPSAVMTPWVSWSNAFQFLFVLVLLATLPFVLLRLTRELRNLLFGTPIPPVITVDIVLSPDGIFQKWGDEGIEIPWAKILGLRDIYGKVELTLQGDTAPASVFLAPWEHAPQERSDIETAFDAYLPDWHSIWRPQNKYFGN
ncbi:MAG: hypothetical protein MK098_08735 [Marinovum sp.]|nr:hypothetical protein [Marinovum sp.]